MQEPQCVERTAERFHAFLSSRTQVKSLTRYHRDMDLYCATSDVKDSRGGRSPSPRAGLASDVLPEARTPATACSSHTGVSTEYALSGTDQEPQPGKTEAARHWYALRTTYGREKKAYDYFVAHGVKAFLPTVRKVRKTDGRTTTVEVSRIPNIFFAYGTEEEMKSFVYDNVNLPYLRFYYRHTHVGNKIVKTPLTVPDKQIDSLRIICNAGEDNVIVATGDIGKFKEGQTVRITEGKFAGVTGKVARYHGQQCVAVVIDSVLTVCTAYIPSAFLRRI